MIKQDEQTEGIIINEQTYLINKYLDCTPIFA